MEENTLVGIICIIAGVICLVAGIYGLAGDTAVEWVGGMMQAYLLAVLGIVLLVVGAVLTYFGSKRS